MDRETPLRTGLRHIRQRHGHGVRSLGGRGGALGAAEPSRHPAARFRSLPRTGEILRSRLRTVIYRSAGSGRLRALPERALYPKLLPRPERSDARPQLGTRLLL